MIRMIISVFGAAVLQLVTSQGTTQDIKSVFEGRCWDYDVTRYQNLLPRVEAECNELWGEFSHAFTFRNPCDVNQERYERYLDLAKQSLPKDKVMFWSGVYDLAHKFSENGFRYITLEDTMIGYLANSLTWCGQEAPPGINFKLCPLWDDCPEEASESFWAGASTTFASAAEGDVALMVDGSNPEKPAYRQDSFFGKYELPNLNVDKVTSVNVIVAHQLDKPKIESCDEGSLLLLRDEVISRGLQYTCVDDPEVVVYLLCADNPDSPECTIREEY